MPGAVRIGDVNSAGGAAIGAGATSVIINGRPACLIGTSVTPHPCCGAPGCGKHCSAKTTLGSMSVIADGQTNQLCRITRYLWTHTGKW